MKLNQFQTDALNAVTSICGDVDISINSFFGLSFEYHGFYIGVVLTNDYGVISAVDATRNFDIVTRDYPNFREALTEALNRIELNTDCFKVA